MTRSSSRFAVWVLVLVLATTFYNAGAGAMESLVNYRTWRYVGDAEWPAFRAATSGLLPTFVIPFFASLVFKILLVRYRVPGVPRWAAWVLVGLHSFVIVVTATIFIPRFQMPLEVTHDRVLIDKLIRWDMILRGTPSILELPVALYVCACALSARAGDQPA